MRNLAGIAAMMALSGGYQQGDRDWLYNPTRSEKKKSQSKAVAKRRKANKKAGKQRHG